MSPRQRSVWPSLAVPLALGVAWLGCSLINAPDDSVAPYGAGGLGGHASVSGGAGAGASDGGEPGSGGSGGAPSCEPPYDDLENCGACGVACEPANATAPSCSTGSCTYGACTSSFQDCDDDETNGCESDRLSDPLHCGSCEEACADVEHVQQVACTTGSCDYTECAAAFADCDDTRSNGCETTANTLALCGDCDTPCAPANAVGATCATGVCNYQSCAGAFLDCDANTANGCETDGSSSTLHCGVCNNDCETNETCVAGNCRSIFASCRELLELGEPTGNGIYFVDPNGGDPADAFQTYCDMSADGGGWTLVLNRIANSDNAGQPDLDVAHGVFNDSRNTNWNFAINAFFSDATEFVFAAKENADCAGCAIAGYDSAIQVAKAPGIGWSKSCTTDPPSAVSAHKLVGAGAGTSGTAYTCGTSLGWGSCGGSVCHYGVHLQSTSNDGAWSQNLWNEMHFPSAYSSYAAYGDVGAQDGNAYCRTCAGGLPSIVNSSSTCCQDGTFNAKSRWTIWLR